MLYLEKYFTNFLNLFFGWKKWNLAIVVENLRCTDILVLQIATLQLFQHPENVKFQFFHLPIPSWNAISPEVFYEFFKPFFWLKEEEPGYCGWKFRVRRYFGFAIATLQLFQNPENVNISILPFTLSQLKCYISRSIIRIF